MSIQSSNPTPDSSLSSASVSAQIESGEPDISRITVGSLSLGTQLPNTPAVSSGSVSSSTTASRNPVDVAKSLVTKRDYYLSLLLNDMIVGTADDCVNGQQHMVEIRNKIEKLNRTISTIKHSVKLSSERVAASIKGVLAGSSNATTGGISLSKRDLPKFQLKSDSVKRW
ncbi:hypothetical protein G6F42_027488 [Rhizopus arrhizus]|nr:hypothetical protein G6F42_027488 [Rhizopus arrhizus]